MKNVRVIGGSAVLAAVLAATAIGTTACGKSAAEKQAEEAKQAIEKAAKDAEQAAKSAQDAGKNAADAGKQAAKGLEELAKGLGGLAGALSGGANAQAVEPIGFRELQGVFVTLDGWEMGKPTGEKLSVPFAYSQAKVVYRKDDARLEASVTDSGFNQLLIAPFSIFLTTGYEKETENGYEKSVKVAGYPGWEKWNGRRKDGELNAFVNKRFLVHFEGDGLSDTKVLYHLADASNLAKLAAIK